MSADVAGYTRKGVRWELMFAGTDKFVMTADHLRDVIKLLEAHVDILEDDTGPSSPNGDAELLRDMIEQEKRELPNRDPHN